ncbi:MAG: phosphotransferase family protein [Anaerolineales bacterium]
MTQYYLTRHPQDHDPVIQLDWVNTQGWESEIYAYTLTFGPPTQRQKHPRVLRLLTGAGMDSARDEYQILSLLHQAGYPVPEVFALGSPSDGLGKPFIIMQRIEGGNFSDRFPHTSQDNPAPLRDFIGLFLKLHTLEWRPFLENADQISVPDDPYFHYDHILAMIAHYLTNAGFTMFTPLQDWLIGQRERVPCVHSSILHWDFHPGNILEDAEGNLFVVDWSSAEISDYRFDLAWTLTLALAYRGEERWGMIRDEYERQLGKPVPELEIFEVVAILRRLGTVMISLEAGAESLGMRPEAVESMRKDQVPLTRLYQRMRQITGLNLPEVESWLADFG